MNAYYIIFNAGDSNDILSGFGACLMPTSFVPEVNKINSLDEIFFAYEQQLGGQWATRV